MGRRSTGGRSSSGRGSSSRSLAGASRPRTGGTRSSGSRATRRGATGGGVGNSGNGAGQDAIRLLTTDHRTVDRLLMQAKTDSSVLEKIQAELEAHAKVEEEIFYPAVRNALQEQGREIVKEALHEHNEMRDALEEVLGLDQEDEQYEDKLKELKDTIQHHVKEEEGEMFPQARQALSRERLAELGSQMESRKEELKGELVEA
jgi:hemerythrin-like domain-containing protein